MSVLLRKSLDSPDEGRAMATATAGAPRT